MPFILRLGEPSLSSQTRIRRLADLGSLGARAPVSRLDLSLRRSTLWGCRSGERCSSRGPTYHRLPWSPTISRSVPGVERRSGPTTSSAGQERGNRITSLARRRERNTKASWPRCVRRIGAAFPRVSYVRLLHSNTVSDCSKESSPSGLHDCPARRSACAPGSGLALRGPIPS